MDLEKEGNGFDNNVAPLHQEEIPPSYYAPTRPLTFKQFVIEVAEILETEPKGTRVGDRATELCTAIHQLNLENEMLIGFLEDFETRLGMPEQWDKPINTRIKAIGDAHEGEQRDLEIAEEEAEEVAQNVILALGEFLGKGIDRLNPAEIQKLKFHLNTYKLGHLLD